MPITVKKHSPTEIEITKPVKRIVPLKRYLRQEASLVLQLEKVRAIIAEAQSKGVVESVPKDVAAEEGEQ